MPLQGYFSASQGGRETESSTHYPVGEMPAKEPAVKVEAELGRFVPDRLRAECEAPLASAEERQSFRNM
jgi:hypothetical protein